MSSGKLKIAYVIDDLSFGGAQKQLATLTRTLPADFDAIVCCLSELEHPFGKVIEKEHGRVFYFKRRSHMDLKRLLELKSLLAGEKADIIHSFLYASNAYAFIAGRMLKIPVILSLRSDRLRMDFLRNLVLSSLFRRADAVTVNSKAGRAYLVGSVKVPEGKVALVKNCFAMESIPEALLPSAKTEKIIGYVGRFASRTKRIDLLIEAFALAAKEHPSARLRLLGDGRERARLENLAKELGIEHRVDFAGSAIDVLEQMKSFSCLVLPSAHEGLPNVVIEALALGIPVITSDSGDLSDIVIEGKTGSLIREPSPAKLAQTMIAVLADDDLAERAWEEGPKLVKRCFSSSAMLESLLPLYRQLGTSGK